MAETRVAAPDITSVLNYFNTLSGTKTSTSGTTTSGTSTTGIDPALLAPLQQVFAQQSSQLTPEGIANLIGAIYREGNRQVPGIAAQFAGATGARTTGNSPLAYANTILQQNIADAAAKAMLTAQSQAGTTAAQIAAAAPKTTTETKTTGGETKTTKSANPLIQLMPFVLANAGKIKDAVSGLSNSLTGGGNDTVGVGGAIPGGFQAQGNTFNNSSAFTPTGLMSDPAIGPPTSAPDLSSLSDMFSTGTSLLDTEGNTVAPIASQFDFSSMPGFEDLGAFFANGGMVGRKAPGYANGGMFDSKKNFADGGRLALAAPPAPGILTNAISGLGDLSPVLDIANTVNQIANSSKAASTGISPGADFSNEKLSDDVLSHFSTNYGIDEGRGTTVPYTAANGKTYVGYTDEQPPQQGENNSGQQRNAQYIRELSSTDNTQWLNARADKLFNLDGSFRDVAANVPQESNMSTILQFATMVAAIASGNPELAFARSVGARAAGQAVAGELNPGLKMNMFGGSYKGGAGDASIIAPRDVGYSDGGRISGPGTGTSDSIPAKTDTGDSISVSNGEFILPADVTAMFKPVIAKMMQFHTPVATGAR